MSGNEPTIWEKLIDSARFTKTDNNASEVEYRGWDGRPFIKAVVDPVGDFQELVVFTPKQIIKIGNIEGIRSGEPQFSDVTWYPNDPFDKSEVPLGLKKAYVPESVTAVLKQRLSEYSQDGLLTGTEANNLGQLAQQIVKKIQTDPTLADSVNR